MNKVDDFLTMSKWNDLLKKKEDDEKKASKIIWIFAILGIVAAIAAAAYGMILKTNLKTIFSMTTKKTQKRANN